MRGVDPVGVLSTLAISYHMSRVAHSALAPDMHSEYTEVVDTIARGGLLEKESCDILSHLEGISMDQADL